jgi:hypothetical protein
MPATSRLPVPIEWSVICNAADMAGMLVSQGVEDSG